MISDAWIDRQWVRPKRVRAPKLKKPAAPAVREPKTTDIDRLITNERRAELRQLGKCINGPKVGDVGLRGVVHGPVYKGDRCKRCYDIKNGAPS